MCTLCLCAQLTLLLALRCYVYDSKQHASGHAGGLLQGCQ
jgi:hypothetical protein